jgi:hypothetical protein
MTAPNHSLEGALAGLQRSRATPVQERKVHTIAAAITRPGASTLKRSDAQTPKRSTTQTPKRPELALQGTAKSRHPDFAKKTLYIRKSTMRDAMRRYEDEYVDQERRAEESDLVEMLLREYAHGGDR